MQFYFSCSIVIGQFIDPFSSMCIIPLKRLLFVLVFLSPLSPLFSVRMSWEFITRRETMLPYTFAIYSEEVNLASSDESCDWVQVCFLQTFLAVNYVYVLLLSTL